MARKPILHLILGLCLTLFFASSLTWFLIPTYARDDALIPPNPEEAGLRQDDAGGDYLLGVGKADITGYSAPSFTDQNGS